MRTVMRRYRVLPMLVASCWTTAAGEGAKRDNERNPWAGFPEGSWIVVEETGVRGSEKRETRTKLVLIKAVGEPSSDGSWSGEIAEFVQKNGEFPEKPKSHWVHVPGRDPERTPGAKLVKTRTENVKVDGVAHACEVKEYIVSVPAKGIELTLVLWRRNGFDVPYREMQLTNSPDIAMGADVLRAQCTVKRAGSIETVSWQVQSLKDQQTVGGQLLACVREEAHMVEKAGGKTSRASARRWLSEKVPGHEVRVEEHGEIQGQKAKRIRQVTEFWVPSSK